MTGTLLPTTVVAGRDGGRSQNPGPAIEARGICKSFGTTRALIDVDLVADAGRVFALLGPNGAGKTTLWSAVDDLVASGTTVLLTTQYLEEADRLAHRIAVMDRGRVVAVGTSDELKSRLGGAVVEMVVSEATIDLALQALQPLRDGGAVDWERQRITLPAPEGMASLRAALDRLDDAGVSADDIGLRRPSLDDVFLALTGHGAGEEEAPEPEPAGRTPRRRVPA